MYQPYRREQFAAKHRDEVVFLGVFRDVTLLLLQTCRVVCMPPSDLIKEPTRLTLLYHVPPYGAMTTVNTQRSFQTQQATQTHTQDKIATNTALRGREDSSETYNFSKASRGIVFLRALAVRLRVQEERAHSALRLVGILWTSNKTQSIRVISPRNAARFSSLMLVFVVPSTCPCRAFS